jgi:hypothetical protein
MDIFDSIAEQIDSLSLEETENLERYQLAHPEEFSSLFVPTAERWRNAQQTRARAKQAKRYRERKKQEKLSACIEIGLDPSLADGRIKRIKVYQIKTEKKD